MSVELHFHKLSENATTPKRGSEYAAGLDLASAETKVIPAKEMGGNFAKSFRKVKIPTL